MKTFFTSIVLCLGIGSWTHAAVTLPVFPTATFNVTSYGASSSTSKDNTSGIQKAIDACATAGGGTVIIPSGTFLSGPLTLKSNVNLQIASGAILRMLPYGNGNGSPTGSYPNSGTADTYVPLIYAKGAKNIGVSGTGTIDGQGAAWWSAYLANKAIGRPGVIRFDGCSTIAITGITIQNAPNVHITIGQGSNNSTVANVTINSPSTSPNTDGIDTWSPNINIMHCNITCGDDNIAMDSESQNVTIKHCSFGTGHGCSIGSYAGNISNILVDSCSFNGTSTGMRLKTARGRGGSETNITYSNITMTNVPTPIYLVSYYPKVPTSPTADPAQDVTTSTPSWNNVTLRNAVITGSDNAGTIWGLPEKSISTVIFDNVQISAKTGMQVNFATGVVFKNCSEISVTSGKAIASTYNASVSGIDFTTGKSTTTCSPGPATLTKQGVGSSNQTISLGSSIVSYAYAWTNASTVTVTGMPPGITVDINNGTQLVSISGTPTKSGVFDFTVTTVGGSSNVSKTGSISVNSIVTDISSEHLQQDYLLYPNPFHDQLSVVFPGDFMYQILDMEGKLVQKGTGNTNMTVGDGLPKGAYLLQLQNQVTTRYFKIMKE